MITITGTLHTFGDIDELYAVSEALPETVEGNVYAKHPESEDFSIVPWRRSLYLEDRDNPVGDVSRSDHYYNVIDYGDWVGAIGNAIDPYTDILTPKGHVSLTEPGHKAYLTVGFDGLELEPATGDTIELGLQSQTGHTGHTAITYDVGGQRQVCSNGMMAWVSDMHFFQTHSDPLDYSLPHQSMEAITTGVDVLEDRLQQAQESTFVDRDEVILVYHDLGLPRYVEDPVTVFTESLEAERDTTRSEVTQYEAYNGATRALSHYATLDPGTRHQALEQAARLLDWDGTLPDAEDMGATALERRVDELARDADTVRYWEDEETRIHSLLEAHGEAGA